MAHNLNGTYSNNDVRLKKIMSLNDSRQSGLSADSDNGSTSITNGKNNNNNNNNTTLYERQVSNTQILTEDNQNEYDEVKEESLLSKNFKSFKRVLTAKATYSVSKKESLKDPIIFDQLKLEMNSLIESFKEFITKKKFENTSIGYKLNHLMIIMNNYVICLNRCIELNTKLVKNSAKYDYPGIEANGYRSISKALVKCCECTLNTVRKIYMKKSSILFQLQISLISEIKDLQSWLNLIEKFELIMKSSCKLLDISGDSSTLFVHKEDLNDEFTQELYKITFGCHEAFFGRTCGFLYCEQVQKMLTGFMIALTSYSKGYHAYPENKYLKSAVSLFNGTRHSFDPELRAKTMSHILNNTDLDFYVAFSRLADLPILQYGNFLHSSGICINVLKSLETERLSIKKLNSNEHLAVVKPPRIRVKVRVLSSEFREGMENIDKILLLKGNVRKPRSSALLLHAHGGGFISQSTKTHEVYLKVWSIELQIPVISVEYTLSPESIYPQSSDECFYAYVWCLLNKDILGWTGEKIILAGDSAGGILMTNVVQRSIVTNIRVPDALVTLYTPFLLTFSLTPSKILSVMDPLLNLGFLWRCLMAYCGFNYKITNKDKTKTSITISKVKNIVNENNSQNQINQQTQSEEKIKEIEVDRDNNSFELFIHLVEFLKEQNVSANPFISPLLCDKEILSKMPKTILIACNDAFLDDNIEMAKLLRELKVEHELFIVDNGSVHSFLNMKNLCAETAYATKHVTSILVELLTIS